MLTIAKPVRALRYGSNAVVLNITYCTTATVALAFYNKAPRIWNGLPKVVRNCFSESTPPALTEMLKKLLKTALYAAAFDIATA